MDHASFDLQQQCQSLAELLFHLVWMRYLPGDASEAFGGVYGGVS